MTSSDVDEARSAAKRLASTPDCAAARRVARLEPTGETARARRLLLRNRYVALVRAPTSGVQVKAKSIRCLAPFDDAVSANAVARPLLVVGGPRVRAASVEALPTMRRSAPALTRRLAARGSRLADGGDRRAEDLATVLVAIGAPSVRPLLAYIVQSEWALDTLARIGRPSVAPLRARVRTGPFQTKAAAARGLLRLRRTAPAQVRPLVPEIVSTMMARIADFEHGEASQAMDVLAEVGRPAVDPLVALARTSYFALAPAQRKIQGSAELALATIAQRNPKAVATLLAALRRGDYDLIADLDGFYIQLGLGERQLIAALQDHGDSGLLLDFVSSGNPRLDRAARDWARTHGYTITGGQTGPGPWAQMKLGGDAG